jgi:hypothetical protein
VTEPAAREEENPVRAFSCFDLIFQGFLAPAVGNGAKLPVIPEALEKTPLLFSPHQPFLPVCEPFVKRV